MLLPIENRILFIRGQYVMLDHDLAALYGVTTKVLNQAVRRNSSRFPEDFMFEVSLFEAESSRSQIVTLKQERADPSLNEASNLRSQFVTSSLRHGGKRYRPFVFTEQGVAMLSSVLRSPRAVQVNIQIMRSFVRLRQMVMSNEDLRLKLDALEQRYDEQFKVVFDAMRKLIAEDEKTKPEIGFREV